jgi:hypothetical protein
MVATMESPLYTASDPLYAAAPLNSPVPPPLFDEDGTVGCFKPATSEGLLH